MLGLLKCCLRPVSEHSECFRLSSGCLKVRPLSSPALLSCINSLIALEEFDDTKSPDRWDATGALIWVSVVL